MAKMDMLKVVDMSNHCIYMHVCGGADLYIHCCIVLLSLQLQIVVY